MAAVPMMPIRLRKFIGAVALFALVIVWALVAMALAQLPSIRDNTIASIVYYVVAGLGWVVPAMPLVRWMSAPEIRNQKSEVRSQKSEIGNRKNSDF